MREDLPVGWIFAFGFDPHITTASEVRLSRFLELLSLLCSEALFTDLR